MSPGSSASQYRHSKLYSSESASTSSVNAGRSSPVAAATCSRIGRPWTPPTRLASSIRCACSWTRGTDVGGAMAIAVQHAFTHKRTRAATPASTTSDRLRLARRNSTAAFGDHKRTPTRWRVRLAREANTTTYRITFVWKVRVRPFGAKEIATAAAGAAAGATPSSAPPTRTRLGASRPASGVAPSAPQAEG